MKKLFITVLLAACASMVFAQYDLRVPMTPELRKVKESQVKPGAQIPKTQKHNADEQAAKMQKAPKHAAQAVETLEFTSFQMSYFKGSTFAFDGGDFSTYKTKITFYDDNSVSFENLLNLAAHNNDFDQEFTISGKYDRQKGIISIETPLDHLPNVALLYSYYNGAMVAGTLNEDFAIVPEEALELKVSDDLKTIETLQDILILEVDDDGSTAVHTCMKYIKMYRAQEGAVMKVFNEDNTVVFKDALFPNTSKTKNVYFANIGDADMNFSVSMNPEDSPFKVTPAIGVLHSMGMNTLSVTYNPQEPGEHKAVMTLSGAEDFEAEISGRCDEYPDYSGIVDEGDITLHTGVEFPFQMVRQIGWVAQSSCGYNVGNSWLEAEVVVPEGKIGTMKWTGRTYSDSTWGSIGTVTMDGTNVLFSSTMGYQDIDGSCKFTEGTHTVRFNYEVKYPEYVTDEDLMQVRSLSFTLDDIVPDNAELPLGNKLEYGNFIQGEADAIVYAKILNTGSNQLKCTGSVNAPHFSAYVEEDAVGIIDTLKVAIRFYADEIGAYDEQLTLKTTAGDFTFDCSALVREVPDYTKIVAKDTDPSVPITWEYSHTDPFNIDHLTNEAVNSNARVLDTKQNTAWFEASFVIPPGKRGIVTWDGKLDIDGIHDNNQYYDYGYIYIAHPGRQYGMVLIGNDDCSSKGCYSGWDDTVNTSNYYTAGENYIQWAVSHFGDSYYAGKDEMRISNFKIVLEDFPDHACELSKSELDFGQMLLGKTNSNTVQLINKGGELLKIYAIDCDAPVIVSGTPSWECSYLYGFDLTFYFVGSEAGTKEGVITLYTNAGEVTLPYRGTVIDGSKYLLAEDFEDEMNWYRTDADGDGKGWNLLYNIYSTMSQGHAHSGIDGMGSSGYYYYMGDIDPDDWTYSPMVTIPADGEYELSWWIGVDEEDDDTYGHNYSVYVGEEMNRQTLTQMFTEKLDRTGWQERSISLKQWAGKTVCVAYRHHDSYGLGILKLDDVYVRPVESSGIKNVSSGDNSSALYNLQGIRVNNDYKGIVIKNGKKVIK